MIPHGELYDWTLIKANRKKACASKHLHVAGLNSTQYCVHLHCGKLVLMYKDLHKC